MTVMGNNHPVDTPLESISLGPLFTHIVAYRELLVRERPFRIPMLTNLSTLRPVTMAGRLDSCLMV